MSRGIGGVEVIQELLPEWVALVAAVLTQLGDAWFLSLLLLALYWTGREADDVLLVGGLYLAAVGVYRTLKYSFGLPRPNETLLEPELVPGLLRPFYEATAFATSYGFPSGHATSAATVYVGLAAALAVGTRRRRYAAAGLLVAVVSLTRVVLGLHYLVDVVVGALLGVGLVSAGFAARDRFDDGVTTVLLAGVATTASYLYASGGTDQSVAAFGAALGLVGGWQLVVLARGADAAGRDPAGNARRRGWIAALAAGSLLLSVPTVPLLTGEPLPTAGLSGLLAGFLVLAPTVRQAGARQRLVTIVWAGLDNAGATVRRLLRPTG